MMRLTGFKTDQIFYTDRRSDTLKSHGMQLRLLGWLNSLFSLGVSELSTAFAIHHCNTELRSALWGENFVGK